MRREIRPDFIKPAAHNLQKLTNQIPVPTASINISRAAGYLGKRNPLSGS
ncbi:hypothetical protein FH603_2232 [Spirosoma sp. LMG 31447]|uniref:Uncharacterized protein n=1 Tax=Spirosoma utsteinense TaxID=2585773 RepID=A0ABR6W583_9BACT|nr:hypothetical protein [Spirosoma utsteinense]